MIRWLRKRWHYSKLSKEGRQWLGWPRWRDCPYCRRMSEDEKRVMCDCFRYEWVPDPWNEIDNCGYQRCVCWATLEIIEV